MYHFVSLKDVDQRNLEKACGILCRLGRHYKNPVAD